MALSVTRQQFEHDWRFHHAVYELVETKAKQRAGGEWDWDQFETALRPVEFDILLVLNFVYSWENNGQFIDTVSWYEDRFDRVDRAFRRLGFNTASVLMPCALELDAIQDPYLKEGIALPEDIGAEVERVNQAASADVSEERLTAAIVSRAEEFTV